MSAPVLLAIDLGKTSCRARLTRGPLLRGQASGPGSPGLADTDGAARAHRAIVEAVAGIDPRHLVDLAGVGVGAAGAEASPLAARELVDLLRRSFGVPVALLNDALAAHVGAFAGAPGTVLIAGTGAVAFRVDSTGGIRQVDGLGPWLGDDGSGCWIGRKGLQAALRSADGRAPDTLLRADAEALAGGLDRLPQWVGASGTPARTLASFAPRVLDRAAEGDPTAVGVVDAACALLSRTAGAAAATDTTVAVTGGLMSHPYFSTRLDIALAAMHLSRVSALGDALSGAALVAGDSGLPHERKVIRG
ncbi:hypothetical protein GY21_15745 [Cryobacterium roopkundense]|uniref:N-acetylglucosamine kinase-like BadF-type ATPase n=1 Tax=Cryobacterium roopkundense TaxID=1001240 RepID=A0A099J1S8_9MICO|nr:BadF/BadG/BcrA/BcrD ATPase family protein [Cryobacterium roopkundense]KGJ72384.1 hypothetical protein GY21_15745 [Cryobacterium roopkundense]MBB5642341.1 N-acetylglucosamine kinase-like BadF-type ATPase [Cryobacterium roopkundense]